MQRINSLLVQAIVTTLDADGNPLHEDVMPAMKIFRAAHPDIWASLDIEKQKFDTVAQTQNDTLTSTKLPA